MYALASYQGLYSQIIVVLTLEGFRLFDSLIRLIVEERRVILIQDSALKTSIHKQKRDLQEDLDVIDIIKFRIFEAEVGGIGTFRRSCRYPNPLSLGPRGPSRRDDESDFIAAEGFDPPDEAIDLTCFGFLKVEKRISKRAAAK